MITTHNPQYRTGTTALGRVGRALLAMVMLGLLATMSASAQRRLRGGEGIVLDDGTATPTTITIAAPTNHYPGARADSLLYSWTLWLPPGPAPQGTSVGPVNPVSENRYFLVADTAGVSRWAQPYPGALFWDLTGNAGTIPGVGANYLGTGDSTAFEIHIDEAGLLTEGRRRVFRVEPRRGSPNFILGFNGNSITAGSGANFVEGAVIHGGGATGMLNQIGANTADYAMVGGGAANNAAGYGAAVAGGVGNTASGQYALAMGAFTTSSGTGSVSMGNRTRATGTNSVALNNYDTAGGNYSLAIGDSINATGSWSAAMGGSVTAGGNASLALGKYLTTSAANSMLLGNGLSATSRMTNSTANSMFIGFNTLGAAAGNVPAMAVVGIKAGIGTTAITSGSARLTVTAATSNGVNNGANTLPTDSSNYVVDIGETVGDTLGSHFYIRHTRNAGFYNPGGSAAANGAIIGIADPLDASQPNRTGDTARLMIRGLGTTSSTYAFFIHDSTGTSPLFGIRDDGKIQLKTQIIDEFEGFNFNGTVGPAVSGIHGSSSGFDLGGCNDAGTIKRWRDFYVDGQLRFDFYRATMRYNTSTSSFDFAIFDSSMAGTLDVAQTSSNLTWAPPAVDPDGLGPLQPIHRATQTFTPGSTGAVDSIDVYFESFTPNTQITLTLNDGGVVRTSTITTPAVSAPGYIPFSFTAYNLLDCSYALSWTVSSDSAFSLAIYDRTPCVTGNPADRARFVYLDEGGWSPTSGIYDGGRADITDSAGGTAPIVQYDTLCGSTNRGLDTCRVGGTLCGDIGTKSPGSYIQDYPAGSGVSSAISVNTFPIDYRFRTYRIKRPMPGISIAAAANRRVRMGQVTTAAQGQLDVQSTTGALVLPRMTQVQREALPAIAGSLVYQTDGASGLYGYDGTIPGWKLFPNNP